MKTWLKRLGWSVLALVALIGLYLLEFLHHGGQFRELEPRAGGACTPIPLDASAEDIQIDRARGVAYLSALDRRGLVERRPVTGTVLQLDLAATGGSTSVATGAPPVPRPALESAPSGFRPHGMSLYRAGDGTQRLFVISHPADGSHTVEVFDQLPSGLFRHVGTRRDPLFIDPNAILAAGPEQFYVANDTGATNGLQRVTELLFRRGLSSLVYVDGSTARVAAAGLKAAAGIAMSPDGTRVYASETAGNRIAVYARNPGTGELDLLGRLPVEGAPDNLNVDTDGSVWIAAHAKVVALVRHFADASQPAPTRILRYTPDAGAGGAAGDGRGAHVSGELEDVLVDRGDGISAGSVGAAWGRRLLIGSITERKVLDCRLP